MIFKHCSLIQEGEAVLFYTYARSMGGYIITGILVADNMTAKRDFVKIWKHFVSEVVRTDNVYCSLLSGDTATMLKRYLTFHDTVEGIDIYKLDPEFRDRYSSYTTHLKLKKQGKS